MKLCYQIATPDVRRAPGVTAYQAPLEVSFRRLQECGYEGAELMVCDPAQVDAAQILRLSCKYGLPVPMVCTGEVFGQDGLSFNDQDDMRRDLAIRRVKDAIDLAAQLGAMVNIGRVRGGYQFGAPAAYGVQRSIDGLRQVGEYGEQRKVPVLLEPVNSIASSFINTTQEGIAMVKELNIPAFQLMLDSNHMFIDDLDIIASIREAAPFTRYVHLVDSNRLLPGNCKLDFASFIDTLKQTDYDGWLSVEVFQRPDQDTALEKSIAYLRPLLHG